MAGTRFFTVARMPPGTAPNAVVRTVTNGQTFIRGAVLKLASNLLVESGATPTTGIVGVAAQSAFTNPGNQLPNANVLASGSPIGGRPNDISIYVNDRTNIFSGRMVNGGTDPVQPALTDLGTSYGVIKTGNGTWAVNQADTTNLAVVIIDIEPLGTTAVVAIVYFKFVSIGALSN